MTSAVLAVWFDYCSACWRTEIPNFNLVFLSTSQFLSRSFKYFYRYTLIKIRYLCSSNHQIFSRLPARRYLSSGSLLIKVYGRLKGACCFRHHTTCRNITEDSHYLVLIISLGFLYGMLQLCIVQTCFIFYLRYVSIRIDITEGKISYWGELFQRACSRTRNASLFANILLYLKIQYRWLRVIFYSELNKLYSVTLLCRCVSFV
jgi:hypothetical protein